MPSNVEGKWDGFRNLSEEEISIGPLTENGGGYLRDWPITPTPSRIDALLNAANTIQNTPHALETPVSDEAISRYEMDAKLQAVEARMDARLDRMEMIVSQAVKSTEETVQRLEGSFHNVKWWAIGTALVTLGLLFAMIQYGNSMFDTGTGIGSRLDQMQSQITRIEAQVAPPAKH